MTPFENPTNLKVKISSNFSVATQGTDGVSCCGFRNTNQKETNMNKIQRAVLFAAKKHATQVRKGTIIPYIVHPLGVMEMLIRAGASENAIVAGILHDTLEDTKTTYAELVKNFGERVADIVRACSEADKSQSWMERKKHTIAALRKCQDADVQAVIFADKTHNLQAIHRDWLDSDTVWMRFNTDPGSQMWYYGEICKIARKRASEPCDDALKTLMLNYLWEHDKFCEQMEEQAEHKIGSMCAGIEREDFEPIHYDCDGTTPWERVQGVKELKQRIEPKEKSLLEQYHELALEAGDLAMSGKRDRENTEKMQKLKAQFTEQDWDTLIHSSPVFMRPMISAQKKKYLGQK